MIHTVHLDDNYIDVKNLLGEMRHYKQGVFFENPIEDNVVPAGYMTSTEFKTRAIIKINKFCDNHGIL